MATVRLDLGGEMESPALESGGLDKSRCGGTTPNALSSEIYNKALYLHVPLFGQMRGCQSAELRLHDCVPIPAARTPDPKT
jgi:hypothetical protein